MFKKALLVGINDYKEYPLKGCVNDAKQMKEVLTELFDFESDQIKTLLNKEATRQGIIDGLHWLAQGGTEAMRVFHYAGHGYSLLDTSGDEKLDRTDEALVPYDFSRRNLILDDDLQAIYQNKFPKNGNLTLIMDCCHSGTIQRELSEEYHAYRLIPQSQEEILEIVAAREQVKREFLNKELADLRGRHVPDDEFERRLSRGLEKYKAELFGGDFELQERSVMFAACKSSEKAGDAEIAGDFHGVFTYHLVKILRATKGQITHYELIKRVGEAMHNHLAEKVIEQTPQLECDPGRQNAKIFVPF